MTWKLWISDFIKSIILSTIFIGIMTSGALYLMKASPDLWWLFVWLFFLLFSIFMMYISPYVIEPLFNKFTPIEDEEIESSIRDLMKKSRYKDKQGI